MNEKHLQSASIKQEGEDPPSKFNYKHLGWLGVGLGILLLLIWASMVTLRIDRILKSLNQSQIVAAEMLESGIMEIDPAEASELITKLRQDVMQLEQLTRPLVTIAPAFAWVPELGPSFENAPALLDMAVSGSEAAYYLVPGVRSALESLQQPESQDDWVRTTFQELERARPQIGRASEAAFSMAESRSELTDVDKLPWRIQEFISQFDRFLPDVRTALLASQVIPQILGTEGEKTYLILAQNEDELRPTGGFISGAGILKMNHGQVQALSFGNSYLVDDYENKPYEPPPKALSRFMGMDLFLFRDANFWPDFSTSARQAMNLYTYGLGIHLDGVIAIDQQFIEMLLEATGPVIVPELESAFNSGNVVQEMRNQWGPSEEIQSDSTEWIGLRKEFMQPLAQAIQEKIAEDPEIFGLARVILKAFKERHLQIYTADVEVNQILQELDWNGGMSPEPESDFWSVIETNIGFNKVNALVERKYEYQIDIAENGQGHARLSIIFENQGQNSQACEHGTSYSLNTRYEDLLSDCYWNFLRVYVPLASTLQDSSQHPIQASSLLVNSGWDGQTQINADIQGRSTVFENMLLIPVGEATIASFEYLVPDILIQKDDGAYSYNLHVRKQAGMANDSIEIRIKLPAGANISEHSQRLSILEEGDLYHSGFLDSDLSLTVDYELDFSSDIN